MCLRSPIISFILRADSAFSTTIFALHFRPVITEGWMFFPGGSWESRSIWKSCALSNLNSSTSDNVGSFSFVDELYSATFVKELGTPNHIFVYLTAPLLQLLLLIPYIFVLAMIIQEVIQNRYTKLYLCSGGHIYQWSVNHLSAICLSPANDIDQ